MKKKKMWRYFFLLYSIIIVKMIIFKYPLATLVETSKSWGEGFIRQGVESANFIPFKTIAMYIHHYGSMNSFENLLGNILVFIPLGMILPKAFRIFDHFIWILFFAFVFIADIELFQLVTRFGEFDVDDIILNMTGVMIGFVVYKIMARFRLQSILRNEGVYESKENCSQ